jgi:hypothetical protein
MKVATSITVSTVGGILTFAVSARPSFIDLRLAGVILMATGAIGLWSRGGMPWLLPTRTRLRQFVDETPPVLGNRVPLEALLSPARPQPDVWPRYTGHQLQVQVNADRPEATTDEQASQAAQAHHGARRL